jgi:hypothetical protein
MLVLCSLQYPLYTLVVFDEWKNGIPIAFIVIGKSQKNDLDPILNSNIIKTYAKQLDA